jgi:hypothetical protein
LLTLLATLAAPLSAQQTHVLIINGLAGEPQYKKAFHDVAQTLADSARTRWGVADSSLIILSEEFAAKPTALRANSTKEEVGKAFLTLSRRVAPTDIVFVFINGHGAGEGPASRVNLSGPDPTAADYASWISGFGKQTVVFVNVASGSGDFVPVLAGPRRVVVSATKTAIERNETIFAAPFVRGLTGTEADADKDGRISVNEAFTFAKKEVARSYESGNKMLTEHAVLSDTALARSVAFGGARGSRDPRVLALAAERQELETQVTALRGRKASMDPAAYDRELERLLLLVAEKSKAIRDASGGGKP